MVHRARLTVSSTTYISFSLGRFTVFDENVPCIHFPLLLLAMLCYAIDPHVPLVLSAAVD